MLRNTGKLTFSFTSLYCFNLLQMFYTKSAAVGVTMRSLYNDKKIYFCLLFLKNLQSYRQFIRLKSFFGVLCKCRHRNQRANSDNITRKSKGASTNGLKNGKISKRYAKGIVAKCINANVNIVVISFFELQFYCIKTNSKNIVVKRLRFS